MSEQYYSTKQMADMLGIPKQRVYRYIKANHISEVHRETVKGNTVLMYQHDDFLRIKAALSGDSVSSEVHNEPHHEAVNKALYEAVLKQLEIKDQQIAELNERLKEANKLIDQAHQLQAIAEQKIQLLEEKQVTVTGTDEGEKPGIFVSLFSKLFRSE